MVYKFIANRIGGVFQIGTMHLEGIIKLIFCFTLLSTPFLVDAQESGKNVITHKVIITEVLQTSIYTYLHAKEYDSLIWLVVPTIVANVGETYYYVDGLIIQPFEATKLHKLFDAVVFIETVSKNPPSIKNPQAGSTSSNQANDQPYVRKSPQPEKIDINVEKARDGISIAELFANKSTYADKIVKIKGKVTKYTSAVMGRNWIHIQDGSALNDKYDLTVTLQAEIKVGDVVTLEGKIDLNKDFGYGYFFDIIMQDAILK